MMRRKGNPAGAVRLAMRGPSADAWIAHAQRAQYVTCTTVDDVVLAARLHQEAQVPYSIARIWAFEPHPNTQDAAAIRTYARARYDDLRRLRDACGDPDVLFQVNNEQGFRADDFGMYVELIDVAMQDPDGPVGLVFWNGATGSTPNGYWAGHGTQYVAADNAWTQDWALRFLRAMHAVRDVRLPSHAYAFLLGVHNYSAYYPLIAVNAGTHRKTLRERWSVEYANAWDAHDAFLRGDQQINWNLPQDHLGREIQAIYRALYWEPTADGRFFAPTAEALELDDGQVVQCPRIVVTECGPDALNDVVPVHLDQYVPSAFRAQRAEGIRSQFYQDLGDAWEYALDLGLTAVQCEWSDEDIPIAAQADGPRGYRTLEKTWSQASWFPGKSPGEVLAYWHQWVWHVIYEPLHVVVGMNPFCAGDTGGWESFNVHGDTAYFEAMEGWQVAIPEHWLGEDGTMPIDDYREITAVLQNMGDDTKVMIRDQPSTNGKRVGFIEAGDTIGYQPPIQGDPVGSIGDQWVPVYKNTVEGYAHAHFLVLPADGPTDPPPDFETLKAEFKATLIGILTELIERVQAL